ncbi:MAG: MATE family efflux transporter, partial [Hungatella sp.]
LGYNYGSRQMNRVRQAEKQILKIALMFTTLMFLFSQIFSKFFVLIFTRNPEYVELSVKAIRISTLMVIPLAVQYTFVDGFTGMGIAKIAISLSSFRKLLFFVLVLLLPRFFGVEAVFYTEPIIDLTAAMVSAVVYAGLSGKVLKQRLLERRS